MNWRSLFERTQDTEPTVEDVREALAARRDE